MTKQLHAVLAVEASLANTAKELLSEAIITFSKRVDHFKGHDKKVKFYDDTRQQENTSETKAVGTTIDAKLGHVIPAIVGYYDGLIQKETTNANAKADLVVDGIVIAKDVPATMLLGLESRLRDVRTMIEAIPTLDPSHVWTPQDGSKGVYRSALTVTPKTEMRPHFIVMVNPTDKFPAMVKEWQEQTPVANIEQTQFAGMWTVDRKAQVLDRIEKLLRGVKESRMVANRADIVPAKIGQALFDYLLK